MKKETLKSLLMWVFIIIFVILLGFTAVMTADCIELRSQKADLESELMDVKYEASKLEPCPMCGEEVKLYGTDSFHIDCDNFRGDGCGLRTGYYDSKVKLIEDWNSIPR